MCCWRGMQRTYAIPSEGKTILPSSMPLQEIPIPVLTSHRLGLTGGMLDAGACADALIATLKQGYPESVLESYAEKRKKVWHDIINPTSQANVKRIFENDPDTVGQTDPFLKMLNDPTVDKSKLRAGDGLYVDVLADHTSMNSKADKPTVVPLPGN